MEIINKTRIPIYKLKKLIKFCSPKAFSLNKITFKDSKTEFYGYFDQDKKNIVIGVGGYQWFPLRVFRTKNDQNNGYLNDFWLKDKTETLIYTIAHEFFHSFQRRYPRPRKWMGCYEIFTEHDCEKFAIQKLELWRKIKKRKKAKFAKLNKNGRNSKL